MFQRAEQCIYLLGWHNDHALLRTWIEGGLLLLLLLLHLQSLSSKHLGHDRILTR